MAKLLARLRQLALQALPLLNVPAPLPAFTMGQDSSTVLPDDAPTKTLLDRSLKSFATHLKFARRIVVLTGAGISTSAGIPDFRSPDTGLYSNLARLDLPYPEAVFDISFFRENPLPFYMLAQELYPGKYYPTVAHAFIALLAKKGQLHMLFTQNIDCLERRAGVPDEKVVEAHGSFATQHCIECKAEYPEVEMQMKIQMGDVPHCHKCQGLVKPDIVFFGEQLPKRFFDSTPEVAKADAMIVMGSSLTVAPFSQLPQYAMGDIPRLLVNKEQVGGLGSRPDDVLFLGDCDTGVRKLADELGWREELEELYKSVGGPGALQPHSTTEAKIITDDILNEEVEKITSEVDHALKISDGHKNWLEKHLDKKSEIIGGPSYTKKDDEGIIEPPATPAGETPAAETPLEGKDADVLATKLENSFTDTNTPAAETPDVNPLSKPARHNETLAISHVDDVATPDAPGSKPTLDNQPTSEVSAKPLGEMTSKVVDSSTTIPAQAESTTQSIPVSQVIGESGNEPELQKDSEAKADTEKEPEHKTQDGPSYAAVVKEDPQAMATDEAKK